MQIVVQRPLLLQVCGHVCGLTSFGFCCAGDVVDSSVASALNAVTDNVTRQMQSLDDQRKRLRTEIASVTHEITKKRKRDSRLLEKCARTLTHQQCLELASRKLAKASKAKAKGSK